MTRIPVPVFGNRSAHSPTGHRSTRCDHCLRHRRSGRSFLPYARRRDRALSPDLLMINGRSIPDDIDTNYAQEYPHQPTRRSAHASRRTVLLRVVGQGPLATSLPRARQSRPHPGPRWQSHPQPGQIGRSLLDVALTSEPPPPGSRPWMESFLDGQRPELGRSRPRFRRRHHPLLS